MPRKHPFIFLGILQYVIQLGHNQVSCFSLEAGRKLCFTIGLQTGLYIRVIRCIMYAEMTRG